MTSLAVTNLIINHMKKILVFIAFISSIGAGAQTQFITSGKIEFEKKFNIHKEIEGDSWFDNFKDKIPKFQTSYYNLYFQDGKTLYEKGRESDEKPVMFWGEDRTIDDIIFSDLKQGVFYKKQKVFEEKFLLSDSIRKIDWRIFNETRDIAGFECRKAAGIVLDSLYVIAFYTDQIPVSGGPLSYTNLPGMILGLAIPRLNLTIMATKLELTPPKPEKMVVPAGRLKKTDYKDFAATLEKAMSNWGKYGRKNMLNFLL